jgi:hypothetical protein
MFSTHPFAELSASISSFSHAGIYRGDHMKLVDNDRHCFTLSKYHRDASEWEMEQAPVCHIVD